MSFDAVLAYFGYPRAHEDDAERAVRGARDRRSGEQDLSPRWKPSRGADRRLDCIVVVGDLLGSGESHERGVVGDTPNLAARLQGIAKPGGVVIAEATRWMIGALFELKDLGARTLKGSRRRRTACSGHGASRVVSKRFTRKD